MPFCQNEERSELLKEYIRSHQENFYRLAYSYTKDSDAAMDVVQEAIVKAISKLSTLRHTEYLKTWFYRILVNESLTYLRKNRTVSLEECPEEQFSLEDRDVSISIDLYRAIQQLEPKIKLIIILRFFEDMELKEIARITQTNLSTVKSRLYKGLNLLRSYLKE